MRFATLSLEGRERVGLINPESGIVQLIADDDVIDLISRFERIRAADFPADVAMQLRDAELIAPIPRPLRNIFCVGKSYRDHAREFTESDYVAGGVKGKEVDDFPAVFTKPSSSVIGPGATVEMHPTVTSEIDYEAEPDVVMGRRGRNIAPANARSHIWGYTIVNDVTARDCQKNHKQWFLGKALDSFCPKGPWITTTDEVNDSNVDIRTTVNGETR